MGLSVAEFRQALRNADLLRNPDSLPEANAALESHILRLKAMLAQALTQPE